MIEVKHSATINKPLEEVYAFAANPENDTKWQEGLVAVEADDTPPKVGSKYTETRKFLGREMKTTVQYTAIEPGKRLAFEAVDGPVPFEFEVRFSEVNGATHIDIEAKGEAGGFFKLAEGAVRKQFQSSLESDFARLKALLEAG